MTHLIWTKQWTFQPAFTSTVRNISVQGVQRRNLILELLERDGLKLSQVPSSLSIYWGLSASMERKGFERVFHFRQRLRKEETAALAAGKKERIQMTVKGGRQAREVCVFRRHSNRGLDLLEYWKEDRSHEFPNQILYLSNLVASSGTRQLGIGILALFVLVTIGLVYWGFLVVCRAQQMNAFDDQSDLKSRGSLEKQIGHFRRPWRGWTWGEWERISKKQLITSPGSQWFVERLFISKLRISFLTNIEAISVKEARIE